MMFGNYREFDYINKVTAPLIVQNIDGFRKKDFWAHFFKRWIALSEGKTIIR